MNDLPKTDDKWTNLLPFILDHIGITMVIWVVEFPREGKKIRLVFG